MLSASAQVTKDLVDRYLGHDSDCTVAYNQLTARSELISDLIEIFLAGTENPSGFLQFMARACESSRNYNALMVDNQVVLSFLSLLRRTLTPEILECCIEIAKYLVYRTSQVSEPVKNHLMECLRTSGNWANSIFCISVIDILAGTMENLENQYSWMKECMECVIPVMRGFSEDSIRVQTCVFKIGQRHSIRLANTRVASELARLAHSAMQFVARCDITEANIDLLRKYTNAIEVFITRYGYDIWRHDVIAEDYDEVRCRYLEIVAPVLVRLYPLSLMNETGFPMRTMRVYKEYPDLLRIHVDELLPAIVLYGQIGTGDMNPSLDALNWSNTWGIDNKSTCMDMRSESFRLMMKLVAIDAVYVGSWLFAHLDQCTDGRMTESCMFALSKVIPAIIEVSTPGEQLDQVKRNIITLVEDMQSISQWSPVMYITGVMIATSAIPLMSQQLLTTWMEMLYTDFLVYYRNSTAESATAEDKLRATAIAEFFASYVDCTPDEDWLRRNIPTPLVDAMKQFSLVSLSDAPLRFCDTLEILLDANTLLAHLSMAIDTIERDGSDTSMFEKFHDGLMKCLHNGQPVDTELLLRTMERMINPGDQGERAFELLEAVCMEYPEGIAIQAINKFNDMDIGSCWLQDSASVIVGCLCSRNYSTAFKDSCMRLLLSVNDPFDYPTDDIDRLSSISAICRLWQSCIETDGYWNETTWVNLHSACQNVWNCQCQRSSQRICSDSALIASGLVLLEVICTKIICREATEELQHQLLELLPVALENKWFISDYYRWVVCAALDRFRLSEDLQLIRSRLMADADVSIDHLPDNAQEMLVCGILYPVFRHLMLPYLEAGWVHSRPLF